MTDTKETENGGNISKVGQSHNIIGIYQHVLGGERK